jgi:hypothetical protein
VRADEPDPWLRREPGFFEWRIELMRLYRRARRRKLATLLLALGIAGAVVTMRVLKNQAYAASVTFRVSEGDQSLSAAAPPPTRELREYVSSIALSGTKIADVMRRHSVSVSRLDKDPVTAVALFREDMLIEVSRNYFIEEWQTNKSARLTITFTSDDAARARAIVNDLAQLVVDDETRRRQETVKAAAATAEGQLAGARREHDELAQRLAQVEVKAAQARAAEAQILKVEAQTLRARLGPARDRLAQAEMVRGDLAMALVAEANQLAVRFERVDESVEAITRAPTPIYLVLLGVLIFVLALPIAIMTIGAFDSRVYDLDDLARLGLTGVGHVPPFRGDGIGSLAERRAKFKG